MCEAATVDEADVPFPWSEAFVLAWESFCAGSPPVGAVIVDGDTNIVARGRSRRAEQNAPQNQLAGNRLAHAEVNALANLGPDQHHELTLYVTLQPCLLCAAATAIAHIPAVCFAGQDPLWQFLDDLPGLHPALAARWFEVSGPLEGPLGIWSSLLPLLERLQRDPTGPRVDEFERKMPELVFLAKSLIQDGTARCLSKLALHDAITLVWDRLLTVG